MEREALLGLSLGHNMSRLLVIVIVIVWGGAEDKEIMEKRTRTKAAAPGQGREEEA